MGKVSKAFQFITDSYPQVIEGINGFGQVITTLILVTMQSVGTVVILGLLAFVEIIGIESGLWFLEHPGTSTLSAIALVAYNMLIDTMIVNIEHDANYKTRQGVAASFKIWRGNFMYRIGYGDNWKARPKSPAHAFYIQRRLITFTVFLIALSGRIQPLIEKVSDVPFVDGLNEFMTQASLQDIFTWVAGITLTMSTLFGVQRLTHYMAKQSIIIKAEQKQKLTNKKRSDTRRRNQSRQSHDRLTTDATPSHDRRMTDATRGVQALSRNDALDMLRRNIDTITPGKSARTICHDLDIDETALRTVQRALQTMRHNNEIE